MNIEENVPLSTLTTFRTGGPARFLITAESREDIPGIVAFAEEHTLPIIPLGSGSNMLPPDKGLAAVLVRYLPSDIREEETGAGATLTADAGSAWDTLVAHAVDKGLWGIEILSAIPGTVGAAVVQNIGAYGAAIGTVIGAVEAYDTKEKCFKTFLPEECAFGYRTSIFKKEPDRYFITSVSLVLSKTGTPNLSYRDLKIYFEKKPVAPTLARVREAVVEIRMSKFPPLSEFGTAGSFFLNPIFTPESVVRIREKYPDMPVYELPEGGVKVPLAWIFDQVLKAKGRTVGGAFIWDKQPLVIAAREAATTDEVVRLAQSVVKDFFDETGIKIAPEVRLFAEDKKLFE